jgi:hypothetical protein
MKWILRLSLAAMVLSATGVAGTIDMGAPLVSGDLVKYEDRKEASQSDLSAERAQQVGRWLEQHRSGWSGMLTEATGEASELSVHLRHSDGSVTDLALIIRAQGGRYLRLTGPGNWAFRWWGGLHKSWAATRSLSDQELNAFRKLVEAS